MTLRPLQHWFENMSSRERFMLLAFVFTAIILWGTMLTRQIKTLKSDLDSKNLALQGQQLSLNDREKVESKITYYSKVFQKSISAAELVNMIHGFVQASGMPQPTISQSRQAQQKDSIFNINSATVNFNRVEFPVLVDFLSRVNAEQPYLVIHEFNVQPENINPTLMDGSIQINSLELKKGALDTSSAETSGVPQH